MIYHNVNPKLFFSGFFEVFVIFKCGCASGSSCRDCTSEVPKFLTCHDIMAIYEFEDKTCIKNYLRHQWNLRPDCLEMREGQLNDPCSEQ